MQNSNECDECDGSGTYYIDGYPQKCICAESQKGVIMTKFCRICGDRLPADRVRYHEDCVQRVIDEEGLRGDEEEE